MKKFPKFFAPLFILAGFFIFGFAPAKAAVIEVEPHIFIDPIDPADRFLNGDKNYIFVGCGSPLFPGKKTHYIDGKTIQYGTMPDGRLIIKCDFNGMYEFACFYQDKKPDGSHRARFMMGPTVNTTVSALEVDSVLAPFSDVLLEPFPPKGSNLIVFRAAETLYYLVKGEKYYGDLNPENFLDGSGTDIMNPYTPELYETCRFTGLGVLKE